MILMDPVNRGLNTVRQSITVRVCSGHVADDVWFDIFALFGRVKLGLTLALISDRFDRLVDAHLAIRQSQHRCTAVKLPLPQSPPLKGIIGFNKITIGYIDRAVINFVRHLFNVDITLQLEIRPAEQRSWHILTHEIWPIVSNKLYKIAGSKDNFVLLRLRQHFGATVLRVCQSRFIEFPAFFEFPAVADDCSA
uniref:Uncharacterized protein n=1 Tax=Globodera rostochiensis TaxID=31243 RepID=A0A914H912_GLORO